MTGIGGRSVVLAAVSAHPLHRGILLGGVVSARIGALPRTERAAAGRERRQ
jgi:hypothetical protein